jgi:hypothetical protein
LEKDGSLVYQGRSFRKVFVVVDEMVLPNGSLPVHPDGM